MATITSNGTGGGRWSNTATWNGGVLPADNDTVVIAAGDVVDMDLDLTGWATGINGITITSHATTPGELRCYTGAPGKYGFKLKANTVIQGTNLTTKGIFRAGTSKASPLPQNITYEIILGGTADNEMSQISTPWLNVQLWCTEPTIKYVQLTSAALVGDTVLNVDQDVTADATRPWEANDYVFMSNAVKTGTRTSDIKQIASMTSSTITLSAGLTYALPQYSLIALRTRNVRFLIQSKVTGVKYAFNQSTHVGAQYHVWCEITNTLFTGTSIVGVPAATTATHGRAWGVYWGGSGMNASNASEGGVRCALEALGGVQNGAVTVPWNNSVVCLGMVGLGMSYAGTSEVVAIACGSGSWSFYGTFKAFCSTRGINGSGNTVTGNFDANSRIEWCENALTDYGGGSMNWGGTIQNCERIGKGGGRINISSTARIGVNVTGGWQLEGGTGILWGTRLNVATPVTAYLGSFAREYPFHGYIVGYDYADSSDVPQYGQIRAWHQGGIVAPDTTPASPPSWLISPFCHKVSHENTGFRIPVDIPLVLEAGTPVQITIGVKLGSAAYSWTLAPRFRLLGSDAGPWSSDAVVYAEAVDANGDPVDGATTAWQTLYIDYMLPVAANRPRGAKVNAVLRAEAWVSNVSGTPYWHWNYTQGAVVNANVQYVNGHEVDGDGQPGTEWGPA